MSSSLVYNYGVVNREAKTTQLQSDIGGLESKIGIEQDKAAALNKRTRYIYITFFTEHTPHSYLTRLPPLFT
jgi:hypothetical protein